MKENQRTYHIVRRLFLLAMLLLAMAVLGKVLNYFNEGADRGSLLANEAAVADRVTPYDVALGDDYQGDPDLVVLKRVGQQYTLALNQLQAAYSLKDSTLIQDQFTPELRKKMIPLLNSNADQEIDQQYIKHNLVFRFLSADRQIVAFTDTESLRISNTQAAGKTTPLASQRITQEVVMFLQDGFWRIAHLEQTKAVPYSYKSAKTSAAKIDLKGINYYPQRNPWDTFNDTLSVDTINNDFKLISGSGMNAVRLFVDFSDFGNGNPSPERLERLKAILDLAQANELQVVLTLFDFYGDYSLANWPAAANLIEILYKAVGEHPAIHSWDLKNEPDLDYKHQGQEQVEAWLRFVADQLRMQGVTQPITIGWSNPEAAKQLTELVDYVSFHYYLDPEDLAEAAQQLSSITDKDLVLQEFGMSTYSGLWAPFGNSQEDQQEYYETVLSQCAKSELSFLAWTLYDFEEVPSRVTGWKPWIKKKQANFGLLDQMGIEKSAFKTLKSHLGR